MTERAGAIYQKVPRFTIGSFPFGSKDGPVLKPAPEGQSPTQVVISSFTDQHREVYRTVAKVTGSRTISVYDDGPCGPTGDPVTYEGTAINRSPAKSKLRWADKV